MSAATWLQSHGAHNDIVQWATQFDNDWERLVRECPRGDWLLAIGARMHLPPEALARAALACVRLATRGRTLPPVAQDALSTVHASAIHWEPFADCDRAAERCEQAADVCQDPGEVALLRAVAAVARTLSTPEQAAMAAALSVEVRLASASDDDLMRVVLESQKAAADAARVHLPYELFRSARML